LKTQRDDLRRCFELLELSLDASTKEIKRQYRDLVNIWHPDRFSHSERLKEKAETKLTEINTAYEEVMAYVESGRPAFTEEKSRDAGPSGPAYQEYRPNGQWVRAKPKSSFRKWFIILSLLSSVLSVGFVITKLDDITRTMGIPGLDLSQMVNRMVDQALNREGGSGTGGVSDLKSLTKAAGGLAPAETPKATAKVEKFVEIHLKAGDVILAKSYRLEGDMVVYKTKSGSMGIHQSKVEKILSEEAEVLQSQPKPKEKAPLQSKALNLKQ